MRWTWLLVLAGIPCFSGCLMVPYVANVTGPIGRVRVLDAETGEDIPGARVAFDTDFLEHTGTWTGMSGRPFIRRVSPDQAAKSLSQNELSRRSDHSFSVPWRIGLGRKVIPLVTYDGGYDFRTYALLTAVAPGYDAATLSTSGYGIRDAGRLVNYGVDLDSLPAAERQSSALVRREPSFCEYQGNGVVAFYLRHMSPEAVVPGKESVELPSAARSTD